MYTYVRQTYRSGFKEVVVKGTVAVSVQPSYYADCLVKFVNMHVLIGLLFLEIATALNVL